MEDGEDLRRANIVPLIQKGNKEEPGSYRPEYRTWIAGKVLEQIIKQSTCKHLEDSRDIRNCPKPA